MSMLLCHRAHRGRLLHCSARRLVGRALFVTALLPLPVLASGGPNANGRPALPGVVIVKLRQSIGAAKSTGAPAVDAVLAAHGTFDLAPVRPANQAPRKPTSVGIDRIRIARYADGTSPVAVAAELARLPEVEYAEPQWIYGIDAVPNDANYPNQKAYIERMRLPQAWDTTKGEQGSVVIAIVDGGTSWNHPDLLANVWTNPGEIPNNGIDDDSNGFIDDVHGWNFANGTNDPTGLPATPINGSHGTHTAGIACAVANNGIGVAGASWNAHLMPINTSSPNSDQSIAFGFQGILYATDNGADIVNCSWGSLGGASSFELDVITYAWSQGTAIVAAAGNNASTQSHYPSAYPHVLSVANVTNFDVLVSTSNRGPTIDVCAQGQNIYSTIPGGYGLSTGTSMSSPHAAAICALVKTRWPGYTPDQVMERVRVTCDNIDQPNPSRVGQLGSGRVNAEAALTKNTPAVRISGLSFTDTDGNGIVEPGETVTLHLTATNYLAAATGLEFRLRETSDYASVVDSVVTLASLDSLQSTLLPPLTFQVSPAAPIQHVVDLQVAISSTSPTYSDRDRFAITVLPTFVTHDANRVTMSVTSVGRVGFSVAAGGTGADGVGFHYDNGPNLLYEGALMMGTGPTKISNAARGTNPTGASDEDFATETGGTPHLFEPGTWAPEETVARFDDSRNTSALPVRVRQDTYAYVDPLHDDYVVLRYTIHNTGATDLTGLRVGWFCDWDIDGNTFDTNETGFDATRGLAYVYDTSTGPSTYVGIRVLNPEGATSCRGIWNDEAIAPDWGVYDNFTDDEKWQCLAGGIVHPDAGPADVSSTIATGPFTVAPGDSIEVGFAFLGGSSLPALQGNADAAALKWQHLHSGTPVELYDLAATQVGSRVVVRWRTSLEENVTAFRVYRAAAGQAFAPLAPDVLPNAERAYAFQEQAPAPGDWVYRIGEVAPDGSVVLHGSVGIHVGGVVPARSFLDAAAPNPFNPSTTLRWGIATRGPVTIEVFDARGRLVRTLFAAGRVEPGFRSVAWDGRDSSGATVASGVYVARMRGPDGTFVRRLTLLK